MEIRDWMTLKEVEKLTGVNAGTLRAYITRNQVIPPEAIQKIGNQWFIKADWIKEKYLDEDGKPKGKWQKSK